MECFVINLKKDFARRESIIKQMDVCGISFQFIDAILGAALTLDERERFYNDRKARLNVSRSLTDSEIGCALSYIKTYQTLLQQGKSSALILEDDVIIPRHLGEFLDEFEEFMAVDSPRMLLLSSAEGGRPPVHTLGSQGHQVKPYKSGYYASSYIINRAAASALLTELYPIEDLADHWIRLKRDKIVDIYIVEPHLIIQDRKTFGSSTTTEILKSLSTDPVSKFFYKLRRMRSILWHRFRRPYRRLLRWQGNEIAAVPATLLENYNIDQRSQVVAGNPARPLERSLLQAGPTQS